MIARIAAAFAAGLIGLVIAFQLALVLGAPWGDFTQGGANSGQLPATGRVVALVSMVILTVLACGLLARVGWGPLAGASRRLVAVLAWVGVGYSAIAVLLNAASPSSNERLVWVPVAVLLLASSFVTVWTTRRRPTAPPTGS